MDRTVVDWRGAVPVECEAMLTLSEPEPQLWER
ncbi:MAG: hypothetical protein JWM53_2939, partial [bacterium]|nr:hypothetical protein [bacterium]